MSSDEIGEYVYKNGRARNAVRRAIGGNRGKTNEKGGADALDFKYLPLLELFAFDRQEVQMDRSTLIPR